MIGIYSALAHLQQSTFSADWLVSKHLHSFPVFGCGLMSMIGILNAETLITKFQIMTLIGFLVLLLIAAICGSIGQSLAGYDLGGCLVSIVVGFIGAYLGLWVAGKFGLPRIFEISIEGKPFPVVWAVIGSALFTLIVGLLRRAFIGRGRY
jgi:uncharacterized membrane protein YeaQ/YmgE (transglycosylase-associated protein family)